MATPKKIIMKDLELADEEIARLRKENKELKNKLMLTENDRDEWKLKSADLRKENKELKEKLEEADKYVVLQIATAAKQAEIQALQSVIEKLRKEIEGQDQEISRLRAERTRIIKENRKIRKEKEAINKEKGEIRLRFIKLQEAQAKLIRVAENKELRKENKEQKEKIDTLELCIKNKDELLEEYRKKIDKFRTDIIYEEGLYE